MLRYWEREFRSIRPTKSAKGQRVYSRKDVENLLRVRDLLYRDGFTIAGAKKRLQTAGAASATTGGVSATGACMTPEAQVTLFADVEADGEAEAAPASCSEGDAQHDTNVDDDDLAAAEPESGPRASGDPLRDKLTALRAEVEGFLDELESGRPESLNERA